MRIFKDYKNCIMFYKYIGWIIFWHDLNRLFLPIFVKFKSKSKIKNKI